MDYRLAFDASDFDYKAIHAYLHTAYWCQGIPLETVRGAFNNSASVVTLSDVGQTVGAARLVTDYHTFAYLADVYVLEDHRGKGLAQMMVRSLMDHVGHHNLRRLMLATRDMHTLYRKFGFKELSKPDRIMEITRPGIYDSA